MARKLILSLGILMLVVGSAAAGHGKDTSHAFVLTSFDKAKQVSADKDLPMLLRVGKGWCTSCNEFDKAIEEDSAFRAKLDDSVVLCAIDVSKDEGADVARMYSVSDYGLTFVLANEKGEILDRWDGYYSGDSFVEHLTAALEYPITINERMERLRENPTEIDARKLGELREYAGHYADAVALYRRAQALNPSSDTNYDFLVLSAMARGAYDQLFAFPEVKKQADVVITSGQPTAAEYLKVAFTMGKVAKHSGDLAYFLPYLETAIERTEGTGDDDVEKMRVKLLPEYALHVAKNVDQAVVYKKAAFDQMDPKWRGNWNQLNNFAWWCFENDLNLDEAEKLARKGVELADKGRNKAFVLDTLAEICNVKGDCGEAVEYIRQAVAEAPDEEYFQKQLVRFEELLAAQGE